MQDLHRYLVGEPVLALPASAAYRVRKFVARNALAAGLSAIAAVALVAATAVSVWQAHRAREQAAVAQRETRRAQALQDFLSDIFRANSDAQPDPLKARQTTARELLDLGARRIAERLQNSPDARAEVSDTLADMYAQLGLDDGSPARAFFASLEADAALRLGEAQRRGGDFVGARSALERAVRLREANDDPARSPWLAEAQVALAECLIDQGERDGARRLLAAARELEAAHPVLGEQFRAPLAHAAARAGTR